MGLFSRNPKIEVCDMCGKADIEGCGSVTNHVVKIQVDEPSWLPAEFRAQAPGEFTWMCSRCNSFPAMKWPKESGAWASMTMHLGQAHYVGQFKGLGGPRVEMIEVR